MGENEEKLIKEKHFNVKIELTRLFIIWTIQSVIMTYNNCM